MFYRRSPSGSKTTRWPVERMVGFLEEAGRRHGIDLPCRYGRDHEGQLWAFRYSSERDRLIYFSTRMDTQ